MFILDSLIVPFSEDVLREDIYSECDDCNAKAGEEVGEHCAVGEHWVSPPGITLGPWIK